MHILPVIDLLGGNVVRGLAGNRAAYRPVESVLAPHPTPAAIGRAFAEQFGFTDVYIADLDAIAGTPPAWADYEAIAAAGLELWVDAGVGNVRRASELARAGVSDRPLHRIIVGLESLAGEASLHEIAAAVGPDRLVFSLDLRNGRPLTTAKDFAERSPGQIAAIVYAAGLREMIVLDLARVGVGQGTGTETLVRQLREDFPELKLIGGGGIRGMEDVDRLVKSGLSRVLVASALHDGRIASDRGTERP